MVVVIRVGVDTEWAGTGFGFRVRHYYEPQLDMRQVDFGYPV
jgi:hypothetical protein